MVRALAPVGALLGSLALLMAGNSLLGTLLAVRLGLAQTPPELIGPVMASYSLGFVGGALVARRVIRGVGHIRGFAAFAAFAASAALLHTLIPGALAWAALRVVSGFCVAGMLMVTESWINERATNAVRGAMLAGYMIVNFAAVGGGQFLIGAANVEANALFSVAAMLIALSLAPLALTRSAQPRTPNPSAFGLMRLYRVSPLALAGAVAAGVASGAFGGMGAVYAQGVGLTVSDLSVFMGLGLLAGLVLQWPVGLLSDRLDRRHILFGALAAAALLALALATLGLAVGWLGEGGLPRWALISLTCAYTATVYSVYPLCIAHANDFAAPDETVGAASGLLLMWGAGTIFGPIAAALGMVLVGPPGFWLLAAVVLAAVAGFAMWRMGQRPTVEDGMRFIATPPAATPAVFALDPRAAAAVKAETEEAAAAAAAAAEPEEAAAAAAEPAQPVRSVTADAPDDGGAGEVGETPARDPGERPAEPSAEPSSEPSGEAEDAASPDTDDGAPEAPLDD